MNNAILSSTFLLTLLLMVGLFFFIKASVKDRVQQVRLLAEKEEDSLLSQLQQYFSDRAYRVTAIDDRQNQVTFEGFVRPSLFLAGFLTLLTAIGTLCLSLVLSILLPNLSGILLSLVLLSPAAGLFYWKKAARLERVSVKLETVEDKSATVKSAIAVTAHRDEVVELQRALGLRRAEAESI